MPYFSPIVIDKYSSEPPSNCPASKITWFCGANGEDINFIDRKWRHQIFQKHPSRFSIELAHIYMEVYETEGRYAATTKLVEWDKFLLDFNIKLAVNEEAITKYAKELAFKCKVFALGKDYSDNRLRILSLIAKDESINMPNKEELGVCLRLSDPTWWRRALRKKHRRGLEKAALSLNLVNKRRSIYVSDESYRCYMQQSRRNQELLDTMIASNEVGQEYTLAELSQLSVSNPRVRRSELMVRISGIEKFAQSNGHIGVFYTITCPSRMHCSLSRSGSRNPNYDNTTPKEASAYLNTLWQRIRAKLNRNEADIYGLRVTEPHHDGTPHWHLLVFMESTQKKFVDQVFKHYALADSPSEPGAIKRRVTDKLIDWKRGTATGYVAKYISKNIDGFAIDKDEYGNNSNIAAQRVTAWASTWGIRQFQFFGVPPISQWRELRRLSLDGLPDNKVRRCCQAADNNDWYEYMKELGGIRTKLKHIPIKLLKVWTDHLGKYGEPRGYITKGIEFDNVSYITRPHTWTIEAKPKTHTNENRLHMGRNHMVNGVERPPSGAARRGVPAPSM